MENTETSAPPASRSGLAGVIFALFFLSGISGLMYQVVWVRMLGRVLGNTVFATATILAAFMAGLAVGSWLIGRYVDRLRRPLLTYAILELGVGLTAALSVQLPGWPTPLYQAIFNLTNQSRVSLTVGQVLTSMFVLLIPTAMMGATLPVLTVQATGGGRSFAGSVGFLYALNTLGAMLGTLTSGFYLLGEVGESRTIYIGVALNVLVGILALLLSRAPWALLPERLEEPVAASTDAPEPVVTDLHRYSDAVRWVVLVSFAASGLVVVAFEIVWSRMLVLYQGTSIYSFSGMLTMVLGGIGLGSLAGAGLAGRSRDPLRLLARLELGMALAALSGLMAYTHLHRGIFTPPFIVVAPTALLSGLAFPVAARCYRHARGAGRSIGTLYAWNTFGCIVGALVCGFVLIPAMGASRTGVLLCAVSGLIGLALLAADSAWRQPAWRLAPDLALLIPVAVLLMQVGDPYQHVMHEKIITLFPNGAKLYSEVEDSTAAITAFGPRDDTRWFKQLWVNGIGMTSLITPTKLMAHLPIWLAEKPHDRQEDVLVICFGMGTTFRSASRHPDVDVTAVDIVPGVPDCFGFYHSDYLSVLAQPNAHIVIDDGRNYLSMRAKKYDVITIDPAPPLYSAGTVNLYTRDFFVLCKSRVNEGGVVCLWVPPWIDTEVKMICRSFVSVFENTTVWSPAGPYRGLYLIGSLKPLTHIDQRVRAGYTDPRTVADLTEWDQEYARPQDVLNCYMGTGEELSTILADVPIMTDDQPWTEFPLWREFALNGKAPPIMEGNLLSRLVKPHIPWPHAPAARHPAATQPPATQPAATQTRPAEN